MSLLCVIGWHDWRVRYWGVAAWLPYPDILIGEHPAERRCMRCGRTEPWRRA